MNTAKIKIGQQEQAQKAIFLLHTGVIQCGRFEYRGGCREQFRSIYERITDVAFDRPIDGVLDVSGYRYWDAIRIYNDFILKRWCARISSRRIERFATETAIVQMLDVIRAEFRRSVGAKWKRLFKRSDPLSPDTPKMAWQIL
jgi:hypothetical protein